MILLIPFHSIALVLIHCNDYHRMDDSVVVSNSLVLETAQGTHFGAWWSETVMAVTEWGTKISLLNDCRLQLQ